MGSDLDFLQIPLLLAENLTIGFTFILLFARFSGLFLFLPGMGGTRGLAVKFPALIILTVVTTKVSPPTALPLNEGLMVGMIASELIFGSMLGIISFIIISSCQMAGQLASTSMGLQAGAIIDPSTGGQTADLARLNGDIATILFLVTGGHYFVFAAATGMVGDIRPGEFVTHLETVDTLVRLTGDTFRYGLILSSPIVVALLLTQFVMGLVSKAVPTVNIFIVSFPLTIGIGLILTILVLPELPTVMIELFQRQQSVITAIVRT